jgi:hypothetical protein
MADGYQVQAVEDVAPLTHSDFVFPKVCYVLKRLKDGQEVRLRLRRSLGWQAGQVISQEALAAASGSA